jgi:hypothetical protein
VVNRSRVYPEYRRHQAARASLPMAASSCSTSRLTRLAFRSYRPSSSLGRPTTSCADQRCSRNTLHGKPRSTLRFELAQPNSPHFGPRLGTATLARPDDPGMSVVTETPGLVTMTTRGLVPHLSRDHQAGAAAIRWMGLPFESL